LKRPLDGQALVADGGLGRRAEQLADEVEVVVEEVVLLVAGALDDGDDPAGVVVDRLAGVVAVPEALGAARTGVRADAGFDVERAVPAAADFGLS